MTLGPSQPCPAANDADGVRRVEAKIATETDFNPSCRRSCNVLAMSLPYHGLSDRMNTEHEKLRAEDSIRYADNVVDIARGLGNQVTMVGISCGGLVTGWAAQQRGDLDI